MRPPARLARRAPAAILLVLAAAASAQTPRVTFSPATSTDLGVSNPAGEVVGDFNQDGHLDLVVTSRGAPNSNVKLFTGDGTGSLSLARAFSFADATAIATADFNGDGALDVAMTQDIVGKGGGYGDSVCGSVVGIAIFLGPNMSSFRCLATFSRAVAIQAGDFDGNGRPDIVLASGIGQELRIYRGLFFVPPFTVSVTSVPGSGVPATSMAPPVDLNQDGHLDLVVSHATGVSTYLGNGDGTFRVGGTAGSSNKTQAAAVGDLDGDAVPDIASVESTTGRLLVAFGVGDGSFGAAVTVSTIGADLSDVAIGDIDHDGRPDIVASHKGGGAIRIFFGNGDGTFVAHPPLPITAKPKFLALRDWDEDGDLDLGIFDTGIGGADALAWIALQQGSGPLDETPPTVVVTAPAAGSTISGMVAVTASAFDNVGVTRVEIFAGSTLVGKSAGPPFTVALNTAAQGNGPVTLTAVAFDAARNQSAAATIEVTVGNSTEPDTSPPVVTVPANAAMEATSLAGARLSFIAFATDAVDGVLPVACAPASGEWFPLGTTTVICTATDTARNTGSGSFLVTVRDTSPPAITVPGNAIVEATGPGGATFTYTATATDAVDGGVAVQCAPASGSLFPVGATPVTCQATDAHGNMGVGTFTVTVTDTIGPVVAVPPNAVITASGPSGASFTYTVSARDAVDGDVVAACAPPSGSILPVGLTTITCQARDSHGNTSSASFTVTVSPVLAFVDLKVNGGVFATGQTMILFADFAGTARADLYVIAVQPGGSFFALGAAALNVLVPAASDVPLGTALGVPLFIHTFGPADPGGTYTWVALLVRPGTDPTQPVNRLASDALTFVFRP